MIMASSGFQPGIIHVPCRDLEAWGNHGKVYEPWVGKCTTSVGYPVCPTEL